MGLVVSFAQAPPTKLGITTNGRPVSIALSGEASHPKRTICSNGAATVQSGV